VKRLVVSSIVFGTLAIAIAPHTASAADGMEFQRWCSDNDRGFDGLCMGYMLAAMDAMSANGYSEDMMALYIGAEGDFITARSCTSENVTNGQLFAVAKNYVNAHPEEWHMNAMGIIARAWAEAFPCE
jgi:hypothetical protein